jgi:hypothetical protein
MNNNKTSIFFSKNTRVGDKEIMMEFTSISVTSKYDKYLGLLALVGRSRIFF